MSSLWRSEIRQKELTDCQSQDKSELPEPQTERLRQSRRSVFLSKVCQGDKVRRTVHQKKGGKLTTWDTKTAAGTRTIILPPSTAELLRERKKSALTEWIFPNPLKPEQPTRPETAYDRMKALLKEAGLPSIRFHDLRHTIG